MNPFVSVLIPCRNEASSLEACLDSILAGDYPRDRMEILVIDGLSTDRTVEILAEYAAREERVLRIENPEKITPVALNRGLAAARGEIIARIDAHARVARDYLSKCVQRLETSGADNVGGRMRTLAQEQGPWADPIVEALTHRFGVGNSHFRVGSEKPRWVDTVFGGCYRCEVFSKIGGFNERLERSQDIEFNLRLKAAGGRTLLAPEIESEYYARATLGSFVRHNFLNGIWSVLPFVLSDIIPVRLRHLAPLGFVASLLFALTLAPWSGWPLVAVATPYALANLAASAGIAWRRRRISYVFQLPLAFAALHLAYGAGSLAGVFRALAVLTHRKKEDGKEIHGHYRTRADSSVL